jgi:hypothetical protein
MNRISQQAVEVLASGPAKARVSQQAVEVLASGPAKARTSQMSVEVLAAGSPKVRTSQLAVEVLHKVAAVVDADFNDSVTFSDTFSGFKLELADTIVFSEDLDSSITSEQIDDSIVLSDTFSQLSVFGATFSDTVTFTDATYKVIPDSIGDTVVFSDTFTAAIFKLGDWTDSLTLVEDLLLEFLAIRTLADGMIFAETLSKVMTRNASFTDNLVLTDSFVGFVAKLISDTIVFDDDITFFVAKVFKDILDFTDVMLHNGIYTRATADVVTFTEGLTVNGIYQRSISETLTLSDTIVGHAVKPISDTIVFSETMTGVASKLFSDTLVFSDLFTVNKVLNLSLLPDFLTFNDNVPASGAFQLNVVINYNLLESLVFSDTAVGIRNRFASFSDTVVFSDALYREIHVRLLDDAITFSESLTRQFIAAPDVDDTLVFTDNYVRTATMNLTLNDALIFREDMLGVLKGFAVTMLGFNQSIILPPPEFNDFESNQSKMVVQRYMSGKYRTNIKKTDREKFNWRWILPKYKADEFKDFLKSEMTNELIVTDWEGRRWKLRIASDSIDFVESRRWSPCGNAFEVTVEFVGIRYGGF